MAWFNFSGIPAPGVVMLASLWAAVGAAAAPAAASQPRDDQAYESVVESAKVAYNDDHFDQAANGFVRAIQLRPNRPGSYRNLARTYFRRSQYAAAVAYYDMYLRVATDADDRAKVQAERNSAASRSGEQLWTTPPSQRMARKALEKQLDGGAAYTAGGGGAWGLYRALLRTGFAQPALGRIRKRLLRRLLDEFEGTLVAEAAQPTPTLELSEWAVQAKRLRAGRGLTNDQAVLAVIDRRSSIVDAAEALLNGRREQAVTGASTAVDQNPDVPFAHWLRVAALAEANRYDEALAAIDDLAEALANLRPNQLGYAKVLRAGLLQRAGRSADAASLYLDLIQEE